MNNRLINTKVAGGGGGCTNIVDDFDPFDGNGVALYQLNGNANDVSTNYNGTPTSVAYSTGVFGQAGVFNGSSSKIELPTNVFSFSSFTLSGWVNVNANTDENTLFEIQDSNSYPNHTTIVISAGNGANTTDARFLFRNYLANEFNYRPTGDSSTLGWRHYAMTYDGSTINCYINGSIVQTGSLSLTNPIGSITGVRLGLSSGSRYLNGSIDQVRIFNTALDPLEVEALYTEELCICDGTVDTLDILGDGSCIATYQLDGNANDLSGNYSGEPTDVSYGVGEFDLAGVFNRSSSNIKNSSLGIDFRNQTELTLSAWFKTDLDGGLLQTICSFSNTNDPSTEFSLNVRPDKPGDSVGFFNRNDGITAVTCENAGAGNVLDGQWHHVVFIADSSGTKMYFDGSELTNRIFQTGNSSTTIVMPSDLNQFAIGANTDSGGDQYFFGGEIDQVRIFNKALNSTEVTTLYNETACTKDDNRFNTITYLRDENVGVYTQSYYAVSDFAHNSTDGLIYSSSRSGVGYWNLAKTDINTNTVTTITQGTSPLYGFRGIAVKNNSLFINESNSNLLGDIRIWSAGGTRGSSFITVQDANKLSYNSNLDELLVSIYNPSDNYAVKSINVYDGTSGTFLRTINVSPALSTMESFAWVNTGGDGHILAVDNTNKVVRQLNYNGTDTGLYLDISSYERDGRSFDAMSFIPTTNELIISTNSNVGAPRNMARVFQLA